MGYMEDVSSSARPGFVSMGPPVEVRGRRANRGFFAREEGGEKRGEGGGGVEMDKALTTLTKRCRDSRSRSSI